MSSIFSNPSTFSTLYCSGVIENLEHNAKYDISVTGVILDDVKDNVVNYMAASPADRRATFSGSGFPFHSEDQAFGNSPSKGVIHLTNKNFEVRILFPNSFYVSLGNKLIPPTLFLKYTTSLDVERIITIKLGDPIPYRLLGYPNEYTMPRNNVLFYHAHHNLPVRTQEAILRDSEYPKTNKMNPDFWGLRPSV
jgi:hypothetical protein